MAKKPKPTAMEKLIKQVETRIARLENERDQLREKYEPQLEKLNARIAADMQLIGQLKMVVK